MPTALGKIPGSVPGARRVHRVGATLPATGQAAIFNVLGGAIQVVSLVGKVTSAADAVATTLKITANPTVFNDVDLCTAVAITSFAVGRLVGLSGAALAVVQAFARPAAPFVVAVGTIDLVTSATNAGKLEWYIEYIPLIPGARVTPA